MHQATGHGVKFRQIDLIAEGRGVLACGVVIRIEPLRPQCFGQLRQVERRLLAAVQTPEFGGGRVEAAEQELIRGVVIVQVVVLQQGKRRIHGLCRGGGLLHEVREGFHPEFVIGDRHRIRKLECDRHGLRFTQLFPAVVFPELLTLAAVAEIPARHIRIKIVHQAGKTRLRGELIDFGQQPSPFRLVDAGDVTALRIPGLGEDIVAVGLLDRQILERVAIGFLHQLVVELDGVGIPHHPDAQLIAQGDVLGGVLHRALIHLRRRQPESGEGFAVRVHRAVVDRHQVHLCLGQGTGIPQAVGAVCPLRAARPLQGRKDQLLLRVGNQKIGLGGQIGSRRRGSRRRFAGTGSAQGDCRGDGGDRQALFHGQPPSSSGWIVRTKEGRPRNFFGSRPAWRIIPRFSPGGAAPRPARIPRPEYGDPDKRKPAGAGRPRFRDWCRRCRSGRRPAPPYCAGSGP